MSPPAPLATTGSQLRGILLILGAMACFSLSDAMSKVLSTSLPAVEIAWIRYTVFVAMAAAMLRQTRSSPRVGDPALQVLRGLALVGTAVLFMVSLRSLPMADAAAISFVSPVLITVLAVPFLGETVGLRRWGAVVLGLLGVLVVVRPGTSAFQPAALFTMASSLCWAVGMIITRRISGGQAAATLFWTAAVGLAVLTVLLPFGFVRPTPGQFAFGLALGAIASSGQALLVLAYRHAPASLLAPFSYTQLLGAIATGYFIFEVLPDLWTLVGGAVIAASGFNAARPERKKPALTASPAT